ncbi:MAG: undecaprenyl-diphosphate phosphatase [bacterium]|nr:undecaprenyl-diphosphate phosphatase [bacterium]
MNILHAIVLGIVEGVTEFLPISSTAHLILASTFLGLHQTEFIKLFEVVIQSGAIISVAVLYIHYILKHKEVLIKVMISFLPTAVIGLLFHKVIKTVFFESTILIALSLVVVGVVFLIIEYLVKEERLSLHKTIKDISPFHAVVIGIAQALAIVPGVSRAGIVMVSMMSMGVKRDEAAMYSFLLAIPTILAASALDLVKTDPRIIFGSSNLILLSVGFVTSLITSYVTVKWLIKYLQKNTLTAFAVYRILLGISILLVVKYYLG